MKVQPTVAYLPDKGWFWYIPLSGDMVSVGIVAERDYLFNGSTKDHAEIFQREVQNNEWIKEHLAEGEQTGEYRITGEYSYRNRYCSMDGLVLAGDALGFLDPVFSSGVFLALKSGVMLADTIDQALHTDNPIESSHFQSYGKRMQSSIETMRKIVYAFYDPAFSFGDLVKRGEHLALALTDCLIGNVDDHEFQELFDSMADLAKLPQASRARACVRFAVKLAFLTPERGTIIAEYACETIRSHGSLSPWVMMSPCCQPTCLISWTRLMQHLISPFSLVV